MENNVILINEVRIRAAIKEAETALARIRTAIIDGEKVPDHLIPKLESIIKKLEEDLELVIERGY